MPRKKVNELQDYYERFEKMQRWMITDLRNASIKAHANLLVGMGIFNYIEVLGSFYHYQEKINNLRTSKMRFDFVFNELMGVEYSNIYQKLSNFTKKGAYDVLRCGLTHEYLIKSYQMKNPGNTMDFTIYGVDDDAQYMSNIISTDCGLELITLDQKYYHLRIYNPRLIYDLNLAFDAFKARIRSGAHTGAQEPYQTRFIKRCKNINFKNFS